MKQIRNSLAAALALCALGSCTNTLDTLDPLGPLGHEIPITLTTPVVSLPRQGSSPTRAAGSNNITPAAGSTFTLQLIKTDGTVVESNGAACQTSYLYLTDLDNNSSNGDQPGWQFASGSTPITVTGGERDYRARAWGVICPVDGGIVLVGMTGAITVKSTGTFTLHIAPLTARVQVALKNAIGGDLAAGNYTVDYTGLKASDGIKEKKDDNITSLLPPVGGTWTLIETTGDIGATTPTNGERTVTRSDLLPALYPHGLKADGTVATTPSNLFTIHNNDGGSMQWHVPFPSYTAGTDDKGNPIVHYRPLDLKAGHTYTFNILLDGETATIQSITVAGFEETEGEEEIVMGEKPNPAA